MRRPSMPRQRLDEPLDLGFGVVEMWGTAEAADARCDFDFFVAEVLENFFVVQGWGDEADDPATQRALPGLPTTAATVVSERARYQQGGSRRSRPTSAIDGS